MKAKQISATLVLVTDQFACERIIKSSRLVADLNKTDELFVLNIMQPDTKANPAALEHLFAVAKEYGAQMTIEFSESVESAIIHFVRDHHVVCAVTGIPENTSSILVRLWERLTNVTFYTVSPKGALKEVILSSQSHPEVASIPKALRSMGAGERA